MRLVAIWVMVIILVVDAFGEVDFTFKHNTIKNIVGFVIRCFEVFCFLVCMGVFARWQ